MNLIEREHFEMLKMTLALRHQLLEALTDADLAYRLPGNNMTLGELCRENGEIEQAYIDSFKTFKQDFSYRHPDPSIAGSVEKLRAWFKALEAEMETTLRGLTDDDIRGKLVDRGYGFTPPVGVQFHIYREGLLIFYGKASIYLKAMQKPLPGDLATWIA